MFKYLCKGAALMGFDDPCAVVEPQHYHLHEKFAAHMEVEGLSFGTREEYEFRFEIWAEKERQIQEINNEQDSFRLGHNFLSTMTPAEIKQMLGGQAIDTSQYVPAKFAVGNNSSATVDWREKGGVNAPKNQARCGSCWAFGSTAVTENAHFRATGDLLSLSEQQLVSCSHKNHGCQGGLQPWAFDYLEINAQALESDYPYTSGKGKNGECDDDKVDEGVVTVQDYDMVEPESVPQMKAAIDKGVITVTVEADNMVFQGYTSGILNSKKCGTKLDHAIAAVGYGTEGGVDYWILRNSWGPNWGDHGYIRIAAQEDDKGYCGCQMQNFIASTD